jgi:hypothetical protein
MNAPDFDLAQAHRFFSARCFNDAWALIRKSDRTADEDERMLLQSQASLWHWTQRADCAPQNLSIAYWQLSRIHALLGHADAAFENAAACLRHSEGTSPFFTGYAHEALARSAAVAGNRVRKADHLAKALRFLSQVSNERDAALLRVDLQSLTRD